MGALRLGWRLFICLRDVLSQKALRFCLNPRQGVHFCNRTRAFSACPLFEIRLLGAKYPAFRMPKSACCNRDGGLFICLRDVLSQKAFGFCLKPRQGVHFLQPDKGFQRLPPL